MKLEHLLGGEARSQAKLLQARRSSTGPERGKRAPAQRLSSEEGIESSSEASPSPGRAGRGPERAGRALRELREVLEELFTELGELGEVNSKSLRRELNLSSKELPKRALEALLSQGNSSHPRSRA